MLDNIIENLELIEPHQAFFILKNCLSIPKLIYLLRSAPCFRSKEELEVFDTAIKNNMEKICNVSFGEENWSQASIPIRHAGLGLRSAADLSLPCFLSSSHAWKGLVNRLVPSLNLEILYGDVNNAIDDWSEHHDLSPLVKGIQAAWDDFACKDTLNSLLNTNRNNPWNHCQLLAAQESHTAAWSEAFPIANVGNLLSPDELRIVIGLQTGAKVFESTKCCCDKIVDELGLNGLSYTKNAGRFPRHPAINSICKRSLTHIGLPSTLEPVGLTNDGRRPDGLTLGPWYRGLSLVWDATVLDTFAKDCQTGWFCGHKSWGRKISWPPKQTSITTFKQWQLRPLVCMASPLPLFWVVLRRNLLMCLATLGSASGSTSVCPWLWPGEMLPAYIGLCASLI